MTLTGTGFVNGTVVQWNGVALTTTYVSGTQVTASIPASDIAAAGTASITLFNPAPGGGTSATQTFTVVDFAVGSPTGPQTVGAGQSAMFTITTAAVGGAFPTPVTFRATGVPAGAEATFNPTSVTAGASTTMTVSTTGRILGATSRAPDLRRPLLPTFPGWPATLALTILMAGLSLAKGTGPLQRRCIALAVTIVMMATIGIVAGCAGRESRPVSSGTPAGTYVITVTGSSGTDAHSTTVTLTVQ